MMMIHGLEVKLPFIYFSYLLSYFGDNDQQFGKWMIMSLALNSIH